ncbi:MFS transporter [Paraburkholderia diazotrophica]|uniref:Predicted arabinose efflux permease, MFS family n=1 Tax=Paraburkholderia diazotrophica TaxID=667676 RepID=A0A1H7BBA4_9BURK|nr:MFS transporter [Paraburkholderia diazotrophica]SEJ74991.1 Predicted arabinose efflux permease, MFS family [Paraburkholderia diazotrophica]
MASTPERTHAFATHVKPTKPLLAVSFFAADVQAGVGPFLGIYLQSRGWTPDTIGTVLTLGGIVGMLVTTPAGALVDATPHRRAVVVGASALTIVAACVIWLSQRFWPVTLSQIATAIAGAAMGPAMAGLTLGMTGRKNFDRQYGRNQVANHAGNIAAAALSGVLGWWLGIAYVFALSAAFGLACIGSVLLIPARAVHRHYARGLAHDDEQDPSQVHADSMRVLLRCRPLLVLAVVLAAFNLGNSAMLPLYSLAASAAHQDGASQITAANIIISQIVMLIAAVYASRLIRRWGFWWVILATLITLPLRGFTAAWLTTPLGILPVQIFDGIGSGLQSVAIPALVVHLLHGSGRVNLGQGAVKGVEAAGASLSPLLGGWLANRFGFSLAFVALGSLAAISLAVWIAQGARIRRACDSRRDELDKMADLDVSALLH